MHEESGFLAELTPTSSDDFPCCVTRNIPIRERVHVTHFIRFHDDYDFDDDAFVVAENEHQIRISKDPVTVDDELTVTFTKDRDLLIRRLAL